MKILFKALCLFSLLYITSSCDSLKGIFPSASSSSTNNAAPRINNPVKNVFKKESTLNQFDSLRLDSSHLLVTVDRGKMQDSITIQAIDGSFTFNAGQVFNPRYYASSAWINPGKGITKRFKDSKGVKVKLTGTDSSLKAGEIYGLLELSDVYNNCNDQPSSRSYYIQIPDQYIKNARGGNISVVYEYYDCQPTSDSKNATYTSWVLWLSDIPF